ncbi:MAG: hypothetical protein ABI220_02535 [Candidatus Saccharimonadales bacterium]
MNALVLGGQSIKHKQWVRDVAVALKPHFEAVVYLDYMHWQTGEADIDLEYEIFQAANLAKSLGNYVIVAKSIGVIVAILAIARGVITPQKCVFAGFPLNVVESSLPEVASALKSLPPVTFIQNGADPLGSAGSVQAYLDSYLASGYNLKIILGNTHDYPDFNLLVELALR